MQKRVALPLVVAAMALGGLAGCGDDGEMTITDGGITDVDAAVDGSVDTDAGTTCEDDEFGGTAEEPADLATILADDPTFTICPGGFDVFRFTATAGQVVKISMTIDGDDPAGANDLDMYLIDEDETTLGSGATTAAVEQISYNVEADGVFILIVQSYEPTDGDATSGDYHLSFETAVGCGLDADCDGEQICYTGVDDSTFTVAQECRDYTAATCGQGTAEDTTASYSQSTAVSFADVATEGSFMGTICGDDVDVFSFELEQGGSFEGTLSATVPEEGTLVGVLVGPTGDLLGTAAVTADTTSDDYGLYFADTAGTYYFFVDYVTTGTATDEVTYTLTAETLGSACRLDADCAEGEVCGLIKPTGPVAVCSAAVADSCGSDTDNSQSTATALTSGTAVTTEVVCDTGADWYSLTIEEPSDISATLSWDSADNDLDVYVLSAEGLPLAGGTSYDTTEETYAGQHLGAGTYYFLVVQYTEDGSGTAGVSYSLTVTATANETACTADTDCVVGGTTDTDLTVQLACNTESGICAPQSTEAIMSVAAEGACFDGAGVITAGQCVAGSSCEENVCTASE